MDPHSHDEQLANLDRINARLDQIQALKEAQPEAQLPLDPRHYETTIAQVRRMVEREKHPTWVQAAYADLASRLARVEDRLDEMADSLRMILGQLAALERQDREP